MSDSKLNELYLVTNKHVVGQYEIGDSVVLNNKISVTFYGVNSTPYRREIICKDPSTGKISSDLKLHPNKLVDIAVIKLFNECKYKNCDSITQTSIPIDFLKNFESLKNEDIGLSLGSNVFAIGYPMDLKNTITNQPVVKYGFVSSDISEEMAIVYKTVNNKPKILKGKIFLVDGLIIPGNSGGPIVTPQIAYMPLRFVQNNVVGIVSSGYPGTGIAIIYSTDYIKEVIKMFL